MTRCPPAVAWRDRVTSLIRRREGSSTSCDRSVVCGEGACVQVIVVHPDSGVERVHDPHLVMGQALDVIVLQRPPVGTPLRSVNRSNGEALRWLGCIGSIRDLYVESPPCSSRSTERRPVAISSGSSQDHRRRGQLPSDATWVNFDPSGSAALKFAEQFGLSPVARARLGLAVLKGRSLQTELAEKLGGSV
jgi:hypothetical protein